MIKVRFVKDSRGLISFQVSGHAEYVDGSETEYDDVVCGSVSILAQTVIIGVTEVLKIDAKYKALEADISLNLNDRTEEDIHKCSVLMKTMLLGLKSVEMSYSEYIKVLVEEVQ